MSFYIIIRGPLGVGKTTVARILTKKLKARYVSIDDVLKRNKLDGVEGKSIPLNNFIKANEIAMPVARKILTAGRCVIFDGNFYHKKQITHLIKNLKAEHYIFNIKAPLSVCIERDLRREKPYGAEAARAVYEMVVKLNYGIAIRTRDKTVNDVVNEIMNLLKTQRGRTQEKRHKN